MGVARGEVGAAVGAAGATRWLFSAADPSPHTPQVLPTMAVCFLEVELKINACAQRSRFGGAPTGGEDDDILPKRGA